MEFNSSGNVTQRNLVGLNPAGVDEIMAQEAVTSPSQGGAVTWMVDDKLGSDRKVVDNNGNVVNTMAYTSFGQTASASNPSATPWTGFAGGHNDASTSLTLNDERAYNPATGGWNSKDPIGFGGGDANTGRYAGNSPTNAIDPSGLSAHDVTWILQATSFYSSGGGTGHFWRMAGSDGTFSWGGDYTPGLALGTIGELTSSMDETNPVFSTMPGPPGDAPPTSIYSLMLQADPTLAGRIAQAKGQMTALATTSVAVMAGAPMMASGGLAAPMTWPKIGMPSPQTQMSAAASAGLAYGAYTLSQGSGGEEEQEDENAIGPDHIFWGMPGWPGPDILDDLPTPEDISTGSYEPINPSDIFGDSSGIAFEPPPTPPSTTGMPGG